jgi:murein DD-endopeptidase MepM/ murein hydrolase activator NlpD
MAGVAIVATAGATVVAFGRGTPSHATQIKKPVAVAASTHPEVKLAATPVVDVQPDPRRYTVVLGDTLWGIAARFYTQGAEWTRITQANPSIVDPNQISVGQSLLVPVATGPAPAAPVAAVAAADPKPVVSAMKTVPAVSAPVIHRVVTAAASAPAVVSSAALGGVWACIRQHESGGNYATNTGNGYYGAYQFSLSTWRAMGGSGLPSSASPAVQDAMAKKLQATSGFGQWPQTSRMCGA